LIAFIVRRLAWAIPSILAMSAILYFSIASILGSPATFLLGLDATPAAVAQINARYGFDRPVYVQYLEWLMKAVKGDLGTSYITKEPVASMIVTHLPVTCEIGLLTILFPTLLALALNTASLRQPLGRSIIDAMTIVGITFPNFITGTFLIYFLSVKLGLLPSEGWAPWSEGVGRHLLHLILPVATLSGYLFGVVTMIYRAELTAAAALPFARVARAKGASRSRVAFRHIMPNAALPVVTFVGLSMGQIMGGSIVTETLFSIPGLGNLFVQSVTGRDFPLMVSMSVFMISTVLVMSAVTDIAYALINPKIRMT
jgi:peptide/nickel transport system permease protein